MCMLSHYLFFPIQQIAYCECCLYFAFFFFFNPLQNIWEITDVSSQSSSSFLQNSCMVLHVDPTAILCLGIQVLSNIFQWQTVLEQIACAHVFSQCWKCFFRLTSQEQDCWFEKSKQNNAIGEDVEKREPVSLLVAMQIGTAIAENNMEVP